MEVSVANVERVAALAKKLLTIQDGEGKKDTWIWQHSERVMRLASMIAALPELATRPVDHDALAAACLFHDAGWIVQHQSASMDRWQLLAKPTSDIQRELGAAFMREHIGRLLDGRSLETAVEAIRQCNFRQTSLIEAEILAEAEGLDDVGVMNMLKQVRLNQAEGRGVDQLLSGWKRQQEYQFWEARIDDSFRFDSIRQLARVRLGAVDRFMSALACEHAGSDLLRLIEAFGVDASEITTSVNL